MNVVFQNQSKAAQEILNAFEDGHPYVNLTAEMQSGKTGTYFMTAILCLMSERVENVVIFSGNSEKELKQQIEQDKTNYIHKYSQEEAIDYIKDYNNDIRMSFKRAESTKNKLEKNIHIIWGGKLSKYFSGTPLKHTLFIWDESHYAQNKQMRPAIFLQKQHISANGNMYDLEKNDNYILSVSATPFSEMSDNYHFKQRKKVIFAKAGTGYVSIGYMKRENKIKTFTDWKESYSSLLTNIDNTHKPYGIIRLAAKHYDENISFIRQKAIDLAIDIDVKEYNSSKKDISDLEELRNKPLKITIIIIKDMCRMGKTLDKTYIHFVMETSRNAATDVILQGLIGRCCGYYDNTLCPYVYIHKHIYDKDDIDTFIQYYNDNNVTCIPSRCRNVTPPLKNNSTLYNIIPIEIKPEECNDRVIDESYIKDTQTIINTVKDVIKENLYHNYNEQSQREEIDNILKQWANNHYDNQPIHLPCTGELHELVKVHKTHRIHNNIVGRDNDTYKGIVQKIKTSITTRTFINPGSSCGIRQDGNQINIWVLCKDICGYKKGTYFIDIKTKSINTKQHILQTIPHTNNKEVFRVQYENNDVQELNGVFMLSLTRESADDIEVMYSNIRNIIQVSLQHPTEMRCIRSNYTGDNQHYIGIYATNEVYKALLPRGSIYTRLENEFKVSLHLTKKNGRRPCGLNHYIRMTCISW